MAGYATMTRVRGGRVRTLSGSRSPAAEAHAGTIEAVGTRVPGAGAAVQSPTLRDRWAWFREELGMMTFFLLDPESWR